MHMITPESRLLRSAVRLLVCEGEAGQLSASGIDWQKFIDRLQRSSGFGLFHHLLKRSPALTRLVPGQVQSLCAERYYATLARNLIITDTLRAVHALLQEEGLEPLLFKGLVLSEILYADPGVRPMADIDMLLKQSELCRADSVLRGLGYTTGSAIDEAARSAPGRLRNSAWYTHSSPGRPALHLYWHLVNFILYRPEAVERISMPLFWQDTLMVELDTFCVRTFSPSLQIIYLCLHAMNHGYQPLVMLCDIYLLFQKYRGVIDGELLIRQAESLGLERYLYYGLSLVAQVFSCSELDALVERIRPSRTDRRIEAFLAAVIADADPSLPGEQLFLRMNGPLSDKMRFLGALFFPKRTEMAVMKQKRRAEVGAADYLGRLLWAARLKLPEGPVPLRPPQGRREDL